MMLSEILRKHIMIQTEHYGMERPLLPVERKYTSPEEYGIEREITSMH